MKKLILLSTLLGTVSFHVSAIDVTVTNTTCAGGLTATQCSQLDAEVKSSIEDELPSVSIDKYAVGIANSNSFAQKGLSSEYADRFDYALIKFGAGAAVQGDMTELQDDPSTAEGIGVGATATFGLNLDVLPIDKISFIEFSKLDLFVSFSSFDRKSDNDGTEVDGGISAFSIMARYQIMDPVDIVPGYMFYWGGVSLHTGIESSSFNGKLTKTFDDETVEIGSGQTATITDTLGVFDIESTTTTIPVEVSTSLRTIWALTFYTGAGVDFVTGSTDVSLDASGTAKDGANYGATILAEEKGSGDADAMNLRAFAGLQLNLPFVRVYTHFNKGLGNDLLGANLGFKILY